MNDKILKLFGKAIPAQQKLSFSDVQQQSTKHGYIIHPEVCQADVVEWVKAQSINPNTTFYKSWSDVFSKNRWQLFLDQIQHYISTYGSDFKATPYIPNANPATIDFTQYKIISPISSEEVIKRCEKLLFSGIALKQETIEDILFILDKLSYAVDIQKVRNKEAKMFLLDKLNQLPEDATEMVRFLVYKATASTLLIKSKEVFDAIAKSNVAITSYIEAFGYNKLAAVFLRYKPLFLAFRKNAANKPAVNKLRKLAIKDHKPIGKPFIETILSDAAILEKLPEKLKRINNFKKITLLQTIQIRRKRIATQAFVIRNQKLFIKEDAVARFDERYDAIYQMIYKSLIESLRTKACKVALPDGIYLTLPTSEKSFIGAYPLGTSFNLADHDAIIGINWRGEDGANDIDLSLVDITGGKIGWNSAYYNASSSLVYSGDMTSAEPEATELIYASKGFTPGIIKANLYSGKINSKLKLFAAKERITDMHENYMVNPNNILFTIETAMDSREKSFAVISDNRLILAQFKTGSGRVSGNSVTNKYTEYALETIDCYLSLSDVLKEAGFEFTNEQPEIDLRELTKDTLISLISN